MGDGDDRRLDPTALDANLCRRLAGEAAEDDVRLDHFPWSSREDDGLHEIVGARGWQILSYLDERYAAGIARTRNNLPAIVAQLTAAAEIAERVAAGQLRSTCNHRAGGEREVTDDAEVVTLAEWYQAAARELDAAGVPYAASAGPNTTEAPLDLAGRIRWLAAQRPTRIDLDRAVDEVRHVAAGVVAERDQARASLEVVTRDRDTLSVKRDEAQRRLAELDDENEQLRREACDALEQRDDARADASDYAAYIEALEHEISDLEVAIFDDAEDEP